MKIDNRYEIRIVAIELPEGESSPATGGVYDSLEKLFREHPGTKYRYGFIVFDTCTGLTPDRCNDWNDSPEEALMDYKENCIKQ